VVARAGRGRANRGDGAGEAEREEAKGMRRGS